MPESDEAELKLRTARTIKWNTIDRVVTQVLYALTGIVLARELTQEDFGLVGAVLVFQAFANMFVDSGFSSALIQRKNPTDVEYSTVLWFNMGMSAGIYMLFFAGAPLIASFFQHDARLIPLSRVMFLVLIVNAASNVQVNRLVKNMNVRLMAMANIAGLGAGSVLGIFMALKGFGAWAMVAQTLGMAVVRTVMLWFMSAWRPLLMFSVTALKSVFGVGMGVMGTVFLNLVFQNIYSFLIGNRVGLVSLGYYTQADKWSKMGIASLSQILTVSFLPVLSQFQDAPDRFARAVGKMNRLTAYLLFPAMALLAVIAEPLFHILFGTKWDASIILFQLLLLRGVFTVLGAVYNNYILSLGRSRLLVYTEFVRDVVALIAIIVTLPYIVLTQPDDPVYGIRILLWGQILASVVTWAVTLVIACRLSGRSVVAFLGDLIPYLCLSVLTIIGVGWLPLFITAPVWLMLLQITAGCGIYISVNWLLGSVVQREAMKYIFGRLIKSDGPKP